MDRTLVWLAISGFLLCACSKTVAPEQIHLAFAGQDETGSPTGMRVAWYTQDPPSAASTVKYGIEPESLNQQASSIRAPVEYLSGHGFHHVVAVLNLTPATRYFYAVGNEVDGWSAVWSFKTAPSGDAATTARISVSVFADMGYEDSKQRPMELTVDGLEKQWSATETRARLEAMKDDVDMVWHLGDIAYADDAFGHTPLHFSYEKCYNGFLNWMQNLSASRPYMVSPGNHESECHSPDCIVTLKAKSLSNFTAYNARWHMPSSESGGVLSMWYSWNYGPVHFVSINTETDWPEAEERDTGDGHIKFLPAGHFAADGEYYRWLEADLKAAANARSAGHGSRWIVVGGHRPYGDLGSVHVALFQKYGVDLYVAGHGHSYSRGAPVNGTTYIMVGGAGCDEMPLPNESSSCVAHGSANACDLDYAVPRGSEIYKTSRMATGILQADAKELSWKLIDSVSGSVLDHFSLGSSTVGLFV